MDNKENINKKSFGLVDYGELTDRDFHRLSAFVYKGFGIKLPEQKKILVKSRLIKRLKELNFNKYSEYIDFVLQNNEESEAEIINMIDVISTNKTDFFRESAHYEFLSDSVIPEFVAASKRHVKVWSAGCSTGEEVYTIAMVLEEERLKNNILDYQVYGSDISVSALKKAVQATYPYAKVEGIPPHYRKRYLLKSKNDTSPKIRVIKELRQKTRFLRINLVDDFYPVSKDFDVIFCRNTLIYFDVETQKKVVNNLIRHLNTNGYLFIGHSESLINYNIKELQHVKPTVYKKIS